MFHLFNKTYIDIDNVIDNNESRIVISEAYGLPFLELLKPMYSGLSITTGKTFEDLVGEDKEFPTFYDLIEFCINYNSTSNQRLVLYCDKTAYIKIVSYFYKSIFVNIDAESAYRISKAALSKEILYTRRSIHGFSGQYQSWLFSLEDFSTVFNSITIDDSRCATFLSQLENYRSVEYLLASYLYNGSHKNELRYRVYQMILRAAEENLKEAWNSIRTNILRKQVQERFGTKEYNIDNVLDILTDPIFADLRSTNEWRAAFGGVNPERTPLNLIAYTDEQVANIIVQIKQAFLLTDDTDQPSIQRVIFYIGLIRNASLSDEELESLLDYEMDMKDDCRFWSMKDEENVNIFLADYFLDARKYNTTSSLAPYLLK